MISTSLDKHKGWAPPLLGLLAAIAVITAIFASALPAELGTLSLIQQVGLFWTLGRFSLTEMRFVRGRGRYYSLGLLQQAFVFGPVALAAWMAGPVALVLASRWKAGDQSKFAPRARHIDLDRQCASACVLNISRKTI